jgi:hypothetical protein
MISKQREERAPESLANAGLLSEIVLPTSPIASFGRWLGVVLFATYTMLAAAPVAAEDQVFRVDARLDTSMPEVKIKFVVTNVSTKPVSIYEIDLPWFDHRCLIVAVNRKGEPLRRLYGPADYNLPLAPLTITAGTSVSGALPLHAEINVSDFDRETKTGRLIVFWHYEPHSAQNGSLGEYGGWLDVPEK